MANPVVPGSGGVQAPTGQQIQQQLNQPQQPNPLPPAPQGPVQIENNLLLAEQPLKDNRQIRRGESLLTVDALKRRYLNGIPLTDQFGNTLSDETLQEFIDIAISMLETDLDIYILPEQHIEAKDYQSNDYWQWGFFKLNNIPVISAQRLVAVYPNSNILEYPVNWFKLQPHDGTLRLIPNAGTAAQFFVDAGGQYFPEIFRYQGHVPLVWQVVYTSGFEDGKIPKNINAAIGMLAAMQALDALGMHVLQPGVSSSSLSIDGLSESLQTSINQNGHAYTGLINSYIQRLYGDSNSKENTGLIQQLRDYWKGGGLELFVI